MKRVAAARGKPDPVLVALADNYTRWKYSNFAEPESAIAFWKWLAPFARDRQIPFPNSGAVPSSDHEGGTAFVWYEEAGMVYGLSNSPEDSPKGTGAYAIPSNKMPSMPTVFLTEV